MHFLTDLLVKPYPGHAKQDVERMLEELARIGKTEDFLSERPGAGLIAIAGIYALVKLAYAWMKLAGWL